MLELITQDKRFVNNKYRKWYIKIIQTRLQNPISPDLYSEKHHIAPKSIYENLSKENSNIVRLTAKEHFICHLLLTKFTKDKDYFKMCKALSKMTHNYYHERKFTSGYYSLAKIAHSNSMKFNNPSKDPSVKIKLSEKSKGRKHSEETKRKISESNKGRTSPNKGNKFGGARTEEAKLKISNAKTGVPLTEEHKKKLSEIKMGKKRGSYTRHKEYEKSQCIYCGVISIKSNISRWHNDNCRGSVSK